MRQPCAGADLLDAFGEPGAAQWRDWAARWPRRSDRSFWVHRFGGKLSGARAGRRQAQVDSLTSNIGHLLGTGLLTAPRRSLVADRLAGPDMDSGFGLRTMSAGNARLHRR